LNQLGKYGIGLEAIGGEVGVALKGVEPTVSRESRLLGSSTSLEG